MGLPFNYRYRADPTGRSGLKRAAAVNFRPMRWQKLLQVNATRNTYSTDSGCLQASHRLMLLTFNRKLSLAMDRCGNPFPSTFSCRGPRRHFHVARSLHERSQPQTPATSPLNSVGSQNAQSALIPLDFLRSRAKKQARPETVRSSRFGTLRCGDATH